VESEYQKWWKQKVEDDAIGTQKAPARKETASGISSTLATLTIRRKLPYLLLAACEKSQHDCNHEDYQKEE
jgi:hypothetical protein